MLTSRHDHESAFQVPRSTSVVDARFQGERSLSVVMGSHIHLGRGPTLTRGRSPWTPKASTDRGKGAQGASPPLEPSGIPRLDIRSRCCHRGTRALGSTSFASSLVLQRGSGTSHGRRETLPGNWRAPRRGRGAGTRRLPSRALRVPGTVGRPARPHLAYDGGHTESALLAVVRPRASLRFFGPAREAVALEADGAIPAQFSIVNGAGNCTEARAPAPPEAETILVG